MSEPPHKYESLLAAACSAPFDPEELATGLANAKKSLPGSHTSVRTTRRGSVYGSRRESLSALFVLDPTLKVAVEEATSPHDKLRILREYSVWIQYGAVIGAPRPWLQARRFMNDDECAVVRRPESDMRVVKEVVDLDLWELCPRRSKRPCIVKQEEVEVHELTASPSQGSAHLEDEAAELRVSWTCTGGMEEPATVAMRMEGKVELSEVDRCRAFCTLSEQNVSRIEDRSCVGQQESEVAQKQQEDASHGTETGPPRLAQTQRENVHTAEVDDPRVQHEEEMQQWQQQHPEDISSPTRVEEEPAQERADETAHTIEQEITINGSQEEKRQLLAENETLRQLLQSLQAKQEAHDEDRQVAHREEIEDVSLRHMAEMERQQREYEAEIHRLELEHAGAMEQQQKERAMKAEAEAVRRQEVALRNELARKEEMDALRRDHSEEIKQLQDRWKEELAQESARASASAAELEAERSGFREATQRLEEELAQERAKRKRATAALEAKLVNLRKDKKCLEESARASAAELEATRRDLKEAKQQRLEEELAQKRGKGKRSTAALGAELSNLREDKKCLKEARVSLEREIVSLKAQKVEQEALRLREEKAHKALVDDLKCGYMAIKESLKAKRAKQENYDNLQKEHASTLLRERSLREELEREKASGRDRIAQLEASLRSLGEEKSRIEAEQQTFQSSAKEAEESLKREIEALKMELKEGSYKAQLLQITEAYREKLQALRLLQEEACGAKIEVVRKGQQAEGHKCLELEGEALEGLGNEHKAPLRQKAMQWMLQKAVEKAAAKVLRDDHKVEVEALKAEVEELQRQKALQESAQKAEAEAVEASHRREVEGLMKSREVKVEALEKLREAEMEELRRKEMERERRSSTVEAVRVQKVSDKRTQKAEMETWRVQELKQKQLLLVEMEALQKDPQEELRLEKWQQEHSKQEWLKFMEAEHRAEMKSMKTTHKVKALREALERAVRVRAEYLRVQRAEVKGLRVEGLEQENAHEGEVEGLQNLCEAEGKDLENAHRVPEGEVLEMQHLGQKDVHRKEVDAMEERHEEERDGLSEDAEGMQSGHRAGSEICEIKHRAEMVALENRYKAEMEALRVRRQQWQEAEAVLRRELEVPKAQEMQEGGIQKGQVLVQVDEHRAEVDTVGEIMKSADETELETPRVQLEDEALRSLMECGCTEQRRRRIFHELYGINLDKIINLIPEPAIREA